MARLSLSAIVVTCSMLLLLSDRVSCLSTRAPSSMRLKRPPPPSAAAAAAAAAAARSTQDRWAPSSRRAFVAAGAAGALFSLPGASQAVIDVNNAAAGDFQRYPGLFPTVATKVIQKGPFKNKEEMYTAMESEAIVARLKQYEKEFTFGKAAGGDRGTGKRSI
jgi:hypothetical protein